MHRSRRRSGAILVSLLVSLGLGCGTDTASTGTGDRTASYSKLDATLRARLQQTAGASTRPLRARDVAFFAETDDADRTRREAAALGGRVNTVAGNIVTVQLPEGALLAFAASSAVRRLEGARPVRARLDTSLPATKADKVHLGESPLTTPYKGKNVVVGVIDMGLDLTHDAFRANGTSRVVALWDQTAMGTAPPGFTYGNYCDAAALTGNTCTFETTADHGTHVTGIAAGAKVDAYEGMAPESDIVFVHLGSAPGKDYPESLTTAICDGANFIFQRAAALGKPAVVNMSLGEHTGSHDGQGLADKCLDNLSGQGKILVAAAGNEGRMGEAALHAQAVASSTPLRIYFQVNGGDDAAATVGLWFDSGVDLSVKVGVLPSASDPPVFAGGDPISLAKDLAPSDVVIPNGGGTLTLGQVAGVNGSSTALGPKNITVVVNDDNMDKEENKRAWVLEVTGNGVFDAYLDTTKGAGFFTTNQPAGVTVNNAQTIGFPGIASKVLAVASYVTRNQWVKDGTTHLQKDSADQQVTLGALSEFSSRGPARVSTVVGMKPDIAAPGEIIAAPLNSKHTPADPTRVLKASPNGYLLAEGTSMATPAVAGIVALMLERNRDLTVEQIRTILTSTANTMDAPGAPNTSWGAGKIDALAAVNAVTPYVAPPADAGTDSGNPAVDAGADGSADDAGTDSGNPAVDAGADSSAPSTPDAGSSAPAPTTTPAAPPTTPTVPASPPTKSDTAPSSTSSSSGCQTTPAGSNAGGSLALLPTLLATLGFRRRSREKKPSSRL